MNDHPRHGGNLAFAAARFGVPAGGWLDLSTGVNPVAYPIGSTLAHHLDRLPEPAALDSLLGAAQRACGLDRDTPIAATPGTELAIRLLPLIAPPGRAAVIGPTYGSHTDAWRSAGRDVTEIQALDEVPAAASIIMLANPNNPDGRRTDPRALVKLAERLDQKGGLLVVDEAFADVSPESSLAPQLADLPAVVLRSFGKFFGLPGLRLGFVAGHAPTVGRLESLLGDWPVSGAALAIGQAALLDLPWQQAARLRLHQDSTRLCETLLRNRLAVAGGTDLFVLAAHPDAARIHVALARQGVWTRAFSYAPAWLRIGLPAGDPGFARLDAAVAAAMAGR